MRGHVSNSTDRVPTCRSGMFARVCGRGAIAQRGTRRGSVFMGV